MELARWGGEAGVFMWAFINHFKKPAKPEALHIGGDVESIQLAARVTTLEGDMKEIKQAVTDQKVQHTQNTRRLDRIDDKQDVQINSLNRILMKIGAV